MLCLLRVDTLVQSQRTASRYIPEEKFLQSSIYFSGHVITPATDVGVWTILKNMLTAVKRHDSPANTENQPGLDTAATTFYSKLMYFGMQIRFANTHSLLGMLWIDDAAVDDVNNVNNSNPIESITHSDGKKKGKRLYFMHIKSLKKKLYCIVSKTTGSLL